MLLARRALLAAPALLLARHAAAQLVPFDANDVLLQPAGADVAVLLPALRAHLVLSSRLGGTPLLAASFGVASALGALDLLALCGGAPFRLQGLELWRWKATDGTEIATRLSISGDGGTLRLARDAARPLSPTQWARESWADTLHWVNGALLDWPVRPPLPGSWQATLAAIRTRTSALLTPAAPFVPAAAVAAFAL